jgi:hypothetical protein
LAKLWASPRAQIWTFEDLRGLRPSAGTHPSRLLRPTFQAALGKRTTRLELATLSLGRSRTIGSATSLEWLRRETEWKGVADRTGKLPRVFLRMEVDGESEREHDGGRPGAEKIVAKQGAADAVDDHSGIHEREEAPPSEVTEVEGRSELSHAPRMESAHTSDKAPRISTA